MQFKVALASLAAVIPMVYGVAIDTVRSLFYASVQNSIHDMGCHRCIEHICCRIGSKRRRTRLCLHRRELEWRMHQSELCRRVLREPLA